MIKKLDSSTVFLLDASAVLGPTDVIVFEELKSEFSMQVIAEGTTSGVVQVWLEQSLDGVNFTRLTDGSNVSVNWGSGDPLISSNLRHFASGSALAKAFRAELTITSGTDPDVIFTVILAAR